ncbi:MAG: DUF5685 family protein [bacterium]
MIGVLRPVKEELPKEFRKHIEQTHCSGCVFVKENSSRYLSTLYIYETDFLLYLLMGFNRLKPSGAKIWCTGFPVVKKDIYNFNTEERKIVFAFSVIAAYSFLDDKKRDNNSAKAKLFIKFLEKHIDKSLELLKIDSVDVFDPKLLHNINENQAQNVNQLCQLYRPLISNLYFCALTKLNIKCSPNILQQITNGISDILIFTDSISDFYEDKKNNQYNPIKNEIELEETFKQLQQLISLISVLISNTAEPWRKIMTNILTYGVINYINKIKKKDDKRRSN